MFQPNAVEILYSRQGKAPSCHNRKFRGLLGALRSRPQTPLTVLRHFGLDAVWSSVLGKAHEAARVHYTARRCGGDMAARSPRAAAGDDGDRGSQQRVAQRICAARGCVPTGPEGSRLIGNPGRGLSPNLLKIQTNLNRQIRRSATGTEYQRMANG